MIVTSFFRKFSVILKKMKNTVILTVLNISRMSDGRFTVKQFKFL